MYYHFFAAWTSIVQFWLTNVGSNRTVHFFLSSINDPMFFQYFGILSDFCWRRSSHVPEGTCFCNLKQYGASQRRQHERDVAMQIIKYFDLESESPPATKPRVGLISRRRKRFILNEYELVESVEKLGFECFLLPLETMTFYEQIKAFRSLDVLVGIHGSALDNSVFLQEGSVMLQLLPYSVEHRVTFRETAENAGMKYMEWQLKDQSKTVFHWDLLEQANKDKLKRYSKEEILRMGQSASDGRETLMFWINQASRKSTIFYCCEWLCIGHHRPY